MHHHCTLVLSFHFKTFQKSLISVYHFLVSVCSGNDNKLPVYQFDMNLRHI